MSFFAFKSKNAKFPVISLILPTTFENFINKKHLNLSHNRASPSKNGGISLVQRRKEKRKKNGQMVVYFLLVEQLPPLPSLPSNKKTPGCYFQFYTLINKLWLCSFHQKKKECITNGKSIRGIKIRGLSGRKG